ncbi:MAG: CAP domain-containing protein, partial [Acidimicrobiia bacterium]|nr:CAP domain-containing protein [Acidimicrobiia bacterium]
VSLINQSRAAAGLGALTGYADLTDDARVHTADMIASGQVFHSTAAQLGSYASGWSLLGENVGMGPNPPLLHQAFMNSASHRANILGDYDLIGVGADRAADGVMFVTLVFMKSATPPPTTTTVPPTTTTVPATTTTAPPTTPTTVPVTTTTAPPPTTTTLASADATPPADEPPPVEQVRLDAPTGERPAAKVAGAINERSHVVFRPIFSMLEAAGSDPIVRFTSNGTPVTIE